MGRSRIARILVPTVLALAWLSAVGPAAPGQARDAAPTALRTDTRGDMRGDMAAAAPGAAADARAARLVADREAPAGTAVPGRCADACPSVYDPVTCTFDNGDVQTFGNRCEAERYACQNGRTILSCSRGVR
ncbi:hypothetical protein ACIBF1_38845 [Spirillospora sp. NPDC050679]